MEPSEKNFQDQEFWREHLLKARDFSGTSEEYCAVNGLAKSTFQRYKRVLGFTRPSKSKKNAFVKVVPPAPQKEKFLKIPDRRLPDPKWAAEFVRGLLS